MEWTIQNILLPAGLFGTLIGALVGLPYGVRARMRTKHYAGESARFLRLLSHHILEPFITIGSALLAALFSSRINETLYALVFPLVLVALISFLGMFAPLFSRNWESYLLRSENSHLKRWVLARCLTSLLTWLAGFYLAANSTAMGLPMIAVCVYLAGIIVLWMSIIRGAQLLKAFPTVSHTASATMPLPEAS